MRAFYALTLALGTTLMVVTSEIALALTPPQPLPELEVGQMWTVKDAASSDTRLIIGRIEADGAIISVSLIDVRGAGSTKHFNTIGHMPFARSAVQSSVDRLVRGDAKPAADFEAGYKQWKEAKGGIFTISVAEAIKLVLQQYGE
jgi:hypothetical protein